MPLEPHPTDPDKLVFRSSGRLTPLCMCREPWALERVHREKTPCFDYVEHKPLTDEEIDRVTDQQWAQNNHKPIYAAHRAYARAIERAHGIGEQHE